MQQCNVCDKLAFVTSRVSSSNVPKYPFSVLKIVCSAPKSMIISQRLLSVACNWDLFSSWFFGSLNFFENGIVFCYMPRFP
ncbi:hypothetical protein FKM82_008725 [Ascaphus truei]